MKSVVTGGAGFIGSHLVELLLKKKHKVIVLDNLSTGRKSNLNDFFKKIKFIKCDLSKKGKWEKYIKNADYVFHLASLADIVPSIEKPKDYFHANVTSTLNILEQCRKYRVKKIIYAASSSCYGLANDFPTKEESKIDPRYPYALSKYLGEQLVLHWNRVYKIDVCSLRLFNVYGTRSRTSGTYGAVFGVFLAQKIANKPLTVVGNGKQTRDFTYVTDVVRAFELAAKKKTKNIVYNVGSGDTVSINQIVSLLNCKKSYIPKRPGEPFFTFACIKKIKKDLKWKPTINIKEGIKLVLKNIKYWEKAPVWTPKKIHQNTKKWFKYLN
jgi:UDP-glucose 4-epimerase